MGDANDIKIAKLEEAHENFRREMSELKNTMHKNAIEITESKIAFVEFSTKIDTIHRLLAEKKKDSFSWFNVIISLSMVGFAIEKVITIARG